MKKNDYILFVIPILTIIFLISIGVSYSYFAAEVIGSEDKTTITAAGGVMNIDYDGGPRLTVTDIVPSENTFSTKTFTVTGSNNSKAPMYYRIDLKVTSNTFSDNAIKYKLISTNLGNSGDVVPSDTIFKDIKTGASEMILGIGNFVSPPAGNIVHTYNLELYFPNQEFDQKNDLNKTIKANIEIVGIKQPTIADLILAQGGGTEAIESRNAYDFNNISPSISNKEVTINYTNNLTSSSNKTIGTGYIFNEKTGNYTLTNYQNNQSYGEQHTGQYTCNSNKYNCLTMYKINTVSNVSVTNSIRYTSEINKINYSDTGLHATADDYGISYYYRGATNKLNNNLIWAGFQWKIVRLNGDGSVRLIYNGTEKQFDSSGTVNISGSKTEIATEPWNQTYANDAKYVGYMYGGENGAASTIRNGSIATSATNNKSPSNAKLVLDNWYEQNLKNKDIESNIVDNLFCNDRQLSNEIGGPDTGPGYGNTGKFTFYAARHRLSDNNYPSLKCGLINDRFTAHDTAIGNGSLTYPVGLLTADEASYAGLLYNTANNNNYLFNDNSYWLFSPFNMASDGYAFVWYVTPLGKPDYYYVNEISGYRPVISISSELLVTGTGTSTNPFIVIK